MDTSQIKNILPYVGVDKVQFGMTPVQVSAIWGAADHESLNFLKERVEYRNGISTTYSSDDKLVEIGLPRSCVNATINGISIFTPPKKDRIAELLALDSDAYEDVGIILFKNLGITVTGFGHSDDADVAMSVFSRGHWDEDLESMKEYKV
jgi:hypothetical protein